MSTFKFRLQSVYELRQQLEKEQKERFSSETERLNRMLAFNETLKREHSGWSQKFLEEAAVGISPADAVQIHGYLSEIEELQKQNEKRINSQIALVESERGRLVTKMQDRKIVETMRDRHFTVFNAQEQKKQETE
ncbi:MAG: flagellar export protein FliJ, partial [Clostridia bacterium]|nr:flagellar export protein FliJ [Clostridia bacterium]